MHPFSKCFHNVQNQKNPYFIQNNNKIHLLTQETPDGASEIQEVREITS